MYNNYVDPDVAMDAQTWHDMNEEAVENSATNITPNGPFSNFWQGASLEALHVFAGMGEAARALTGVAQNALSADPVAKLILHNPISNYLPQNPDIQAVEGAMEDGLNSLYNWSNPDPRNTGWATEDAGGAVGMMATAGIGTYARVVMGAGKIASDTIPALAIGGGQGYNTARSLEDSGVDPSTADTVGALTGIGSSIATFPITYSLLNPIAKTFIAKAAANTATNFAISASTNLAASSVLKNQGYPEMAEQFNPLDTKSLLADAIMGTFFAGVEHISNPTLRAAYDIKSAEQSNRGAMGIPTDPSTIALDKAKQIDTLSALLTGKTATMSTEDATSLAEGSIPDPQKIALAQEFKNHMDKNFSTDFEKVNSMQVPEPDFAGPVSDETPLPHLDDTTNTVFQQLGQADPSAPVDMSNGDQTTLGAMGQKLNADYQDAEQQSKLYDVAVNCYLSIGEDIDNG